MSEEKTTFQSLFCSGTDESKLSVPDYQRAFSWKPKQIELFLGDLKKHRDSSGYYFGHFIVEDLSGDWEIVDGQQRITTFILFLLVCRVLAPTEETTLEHSMISRFSTVSYDQDALETIANPHNLRRLFDANPEFDEKHPPSDQAICEQLSLNHESFTRSQRRMILALLCFHQAFQEDQLKISEIKNYRTVVWNSQCSLHRTTDKSVAVNIFEMHNTRGLALTTLEVIKAMLMKHVHDHGGEQKVTGVSEIQEQFGEIYRMEESLDANSFRGELTMEQLFRLHLRVIDDGEKTKAEEFRSPALTATSETLLSYVDERLTPNPRGVDYALALANEFRESVRIASEVLPQWDGIDPIVGDTIILERELSYQFFLIVCRQEKSKERPLENRTLLLWERLLFTRDFHGAYYNLKGLRDDFPTLFVSCRLDEETLVSTFSTLLVNGFRPDRTKDLQNLVARNISDHREHILTNAYGWWSNKIIYSLYKYEVSLGADIRDMMKGPISVEHILPRDWYWMRDSDEPLKLHLGNDESAWKTFHTEIDGCINGLGNLLLVTPGENSSKGNKHPAQKEYSRLCSGGSYQFHNENLDRWNDPDQWSTLIDDRGEKILQFILTDLVQATIDSPRPSEAASA